MASSNRTDEGFLTPLFGAAVVALSLIALAGLQMAASQDIAGRRRWERLQESYRAEGFAVAASWGLLHDEGVEPRRWRESAGAGDWELLAEPEARKLSLAEASGFRGRAQLDRLLGPGGGARLAGPLAALAARRGRAPGRADLLALDASPAWLACGLTLVSPYSRLTDYALAAPRPPRRGERRDRGGQVWRVVVARGGRVLLDRLVRFTGDPQAPAAVIDDLAHPAAPLDCAERLAANKEAGS